MSRIDRLDHWILRQVPRVMVTKTMIRVEVPTITVAVIVTGIGLALLLSACHALTW